MTLQTRTPTEQVLWDRLEYHNQRRFAEYARSKSRGYEAMAANVIADPLLGVRAEYFATEQRRGYCALSLKLLEIADYADLCADNIRQHILNRGDVA